MPNRHLSEQELAIANRILSRVRKMIEKEADGAADLLWALRRKVAKELSYDERGKPMDRRKLKAVKRALQGGKCAMCKRKLPARGAILDRKKAIEGYTEANTRLICEKCDKATQAKRGYR